MRRTSSSHHQQRGLRCSEPTPTISGTWTPPCFTLQSVRLSERWKQILMCSRLGPQSRRSTVRRGGGLISPSDRLQTCRRSRLPVPRGSGGHSSEHSRLKLLIAAKPLYDAGMLRFAATSFLAAALSWTASAEDVDGRYRMFPTSEGFLKLDTRSGAVSECKRGSDAYQCRLVPDEQSALQAEIDRLAGENTALKEQLAKAGQPLSE